HLRLPGGRTLGRKLGGDRAAVEQVDPTPTQERPLWTRDLRAATATRADGLLYWRGNGEMRSCGAQALHRNDRGLPGASMVGCCEAEASLVHGRTKVDEVRQGGGIDDVEASANREITVVAIGHDRGRGAGSDGGRGAALADGRAGHMLQT